MAITSDAYRCLRHGVHLADSDIRSYLQHDDRDADVPSRTWGRLGKPYCRETRGEQPECEPDETIPGLDFSVNDTWLFHLCWYVYLFLVSISTMAGHHVRTYQG